MAQIGPVDRPIGRAHGAEDQRALGRLELPSPEDLEQLTRQLDAAPAGRGFGPSDPVVIVGRLADPDLPLAEVDVAPAQGAKLLLSEAGHDRGCEQGIKPAPGLAIARIIRPPCPVRPGARLGQ